RRLTYLCEFTCLLPVKTRCFKHICGVSSSAVCKALTPVLHFRTLLKFFFKKTHFFCSNTRFHEGHCMSQKAEKPVLQGQRIKTRKRDEKEKFSPAQFRDSVVKGLNDAGKDLDQVSKFLDGGKLDYRRYSETLFDTLFAGGILAPGGFLVEDGAERAECCVFQSEDSVKALKLYNEMFCKLIRRYKYLEKPLCDEVKKVLMFLKGFTEEERSKLAKITGIFLANGFIPATVLNSLLEDQLVKLGLALDFTTIMFSTWLAERDINHIYSTLKRANMEGKLLLLFPLNKRTQENFEKHFSAAGLNAICDYQRAHQSSEDKKELKSELEEMIKNEENSSEIIPFVKDQMKKNNIGESEACVLVWNTIMNAVEWNKKEELVAEQAVKHLQLYAPVLAALTNSHKSELSLMCKVQNYCFSNIHLMKVFQRIIVLFYHADVLSEDTIIKWYKEAHTNKGKSVFLEQMKSFVEWLENAEEESDEEED
ncbi:unnamed protein product, partial [Owenia fusiformis]